MPRSQFMVFSVLCLFALLSCNKEDGAGSSLKVTTYECTEITDTSAMCGGLVETFGNASVTAKGVCWSESENPKFSDNHAEAGRGSGEFRVMLTGVAPNHTYHVRAYASQSSGITYGNEVLLVIGILLPRVETGIVSEINSSGARCSGRLLSAAGGTVSELGICWSKTQDPSIEGDHLKSDRTSGDFDVVLSGLETGKTYYVRAYASNEAGTAYGDVVSFVPDANGEVTVKDKRLQAVLVELFDTDGDGTVKLDEALAADTLFASSRNIMSIEGLENYSNLVVIYLDDNRLTDVSFSAFRKLKVLSVAENKNLTSLDVSNCSELEYFYGYKTALTRFDFSGFTKLRELFAYEGYGTLEEVKVDGCTSLEHLEFRDTPNKFTSLSFSGLPALKRLFIGGEAFEKVTSLSLDLPSLEEININCWRSLTALDLSKCPSLKNLYACQLSKLGSLDTSCCPELEYIYIPDALEMTALNVVNPKLRALDAWAASKLITCNIGSEAVKNVTLTNPRAMTTLTLNTPSLKYLDIREAHELRELDLTNCTAVSQILANQVFKLGSMDFSMCKQLDTLYMPDALAMKSAKIECPKLTRLEIFGSLENGLQSITLNCPELVWLNVNSNRALAALDLSTCTKLKHFEGCQLYNVASLDFSSCTDLNYAYLPDATKIDALIFGNNPQMKTLQCWNSAFAELDLSHCASEMDEVNLGVTGGGECFNLTKIILKSSQTITAFFRPDAAEIVYVE